jgi:hypothetical protein
MLSDLRGAVEELKLHERPLLPSTMIMLEAVDLTPREQEVRPAGSGSLRR